MLVPTWIWVVSVIVIIVVVWMTIWVTNKAYSKKWEDE
ncbi:ABC-type transporter Mla subunit MlaD [Paenibacillus eucommiae]|uniref:ABC-type transporter Mla subunit MlaD n=1 Tax=Paenibacillus eucommiae TaxID=1355755 RepID=A0ABS4J6E6_9BACL|nr:ABC-type transporter Mla subunit MlaD [Paenibacillus eucommiae]